VDRDAAGTDAPEAAADMGRRDGGGPGSGGDAGDERQHTQASFRIDSKYAISNSVVTRDLYHRFFENQMQINGGKNEQVRRWADSGASSWATTTAAA